MHSSTKQNLLQSDGEVSADLQSEEHFGPSFKQQQEKFGPQTRTKAKGNIERRMTASSAAHTSPKQPINTD